ncbi:MAG: DNA repair protein RadA [Synergistaceae bacterium]|nr:DNA repair protein RadA [Synergistaceae bacterium]
MAKEDPVRYVCVNCGFSTITRTGKCASCGQWGTLEAEEPAVSRSDKSAGVKVEVVSSVSVTPPKRLSSGVDEVDRVLGGGLVPGGVVLIGGQPGIGKSTLLLQVGGQVASRGVSVLYISGEESAAQVALRAARLGVSSEKLLLYCSGNLEEALFNVTSQKVGLFILDSVQAVRAPDETGWPGTPNQVRAVAQLTVDTARAANVPAVLVGHITKDGRLAGPMLLEHMVDTVLTFSGEGYSSYRMLRAMKNRYGNTDELGIFEMREDGLAAVEDKSGLYWNRSDAAVPGVAMTVAMEGSTPLVAEIQTLASPTAFPYPKRTSRGIELNRFQLLAAVLEKRAGIPCGACDLYLNVAGGLSIQDPSADLAACVSLASALRDKPVRGDCCYLGEVGLAGEVRPVARVAARLKEAERLGLKRAVVSGKERGEFWGPKNSLHMEIRRVNNLSDALNDVL